MILYALKIFVIALAITLGILIISLIIMDIIDWSIGNKSLLKQLFKRTKNIGKFLYWLFKLILTWSIFIPLIVVFSIIGIILGILYQVTIEPLIDQFKRRDHIIEVLTEDVLPD